jgi:hypothetical protein
MFINFFAVLVAALAGFGVGALWYSPHGFGKRWTELTGTGSGKEMFHGRFSPMQAMAIEFALSLIAAYVLAIFSDALSIRGPLMALRLAFWVWLGFVATTLFSGVLFENRPMKLFYINAGYRFLAILVMALIVGIWH